MNQPDPKYFDYAATSPPYPETPAKYAKISDHDQVTNALFRKALKPEKHLSALAMQAANRELHCHLPSSVF